MLIQPIATVTPSSAEALFPTWRGRVPLWPHLDAVGARLWEAHPALADAIAQLPFEQFEAAHPDAPVQRYTNVPSSAAAQVAALPQRLRAPWLSALLIWHMVRFEAAFAATRLPQEFALHYIDGFHRILDQVDSDPGFADLASDSFLKDLWLVRVVMIPAFAQLWWPRSGLSARTVAKAGPRAVAHVLLRCRGRAPFLEGHTHDPMASDYWNEAGWGEALRLAALALPALPHVKGAFGAAWFYDPAVLEITPRIGFAQRLQVGKGAVRMKIGTDGSTIANATATSPTRRERYREGRYLPTDYALVWARRDLIARYGA